MPELPEVETVRRGLAPALEGRRIARAIQRRPNLRYMLPERFAERLTGRRVERLDRRAKYILAYLEGDEVLLIHLGMSGRFTIHAKAKGKTRKPGAFHHDASQDGAGEAAHDHIVFDMEDGTRIVYSDHRRFGFMDLVPAASLDANAHLAGLGPEPLGNGFSAAVLSERLKGRRMPIKAALLDQRTVAGLGNIYVCEALHRSGISPNREAGSISPARAERLARAIREVLTDAIAAGGSTLRDYAHTDGELGYFQHAFAVYDRNGAPCSKPGCGGTVKRTVHSGRSTFYCPSCQR
ncbi:MAG TPA: bifunctional DNA-formamidopyrimidine glycosylase/DNA-(apurinic or apyrimidinic site) lyase [Parvibaculum sp.]